ncbi:helix-turn-helix domain-containing protein [Rhizobium sp. SSA_523]|uniref:helix-turn-helix domain-containing protein n=1 Tax=Rhizobium sp. SSA_523 TaxID=2952477 RepID=UPI0020900C9F|nr:helix-turn-helix transcriptional regulator [Rhizobium sp. SSA_523]MCO5732969.1 helix-turn-helix transcriptional regulator [Rhizobium sp. SSA_523]WKC23854.1 helix-turn-helix transcriptional regulator [Rhizobium sp. SSA_523]
MESFALNLKRRAQQLGLSNAEVARRAGLTERRYGNYITGRREPDLSTLVKIAAVLQSTPGELLSAPVSETADNRVALLDRLAAAADIMTDGDLEAAVAQAEAVINLRRR